MANAVVPDRKVVNAHRFKTGKKIRGFLNNSFGNADVFILGDG